MQSNMRKELSRFSRRKLIAVLLLYLLMTGICVLFCWLLLSFAAYLLCAIDLSETLYIPIVTCCCAVGIFVGAWLAARKIGSSGWLWGASLAIAVWCIFAICGMLQGNTFTPLSLFRGLCYLLSGMIGGILGVVGYERRKKNRPEK